MPRMTARVAGVVLAGAALLLAPHSALAAGSEEPQPDVGIVEIPYGEPGEVRPAEGWTIDCAGVGVLEGVTATCLPEQITLTAPFDAEWGERTLAVPLRAGDAAADVVYRVRLAAPAPPEIAAEVVDLPLEAGRQTLVPLGMLGITCTLCGDAALIAAEAVDSPGVAVGVSGTHLAVRAARPGPLTIAVTVTDDAGQATRAELRAYATAAGEGPTALHVTAAPGQIDLAALAWGEDVSVSCLEASAGISCSAEGVAGVPVAEGAPRQIVFRALDASGRQALGSVTVSAAPVDAAAGTAAPVDAEAVAPPLRTVAVGWAAQAPLGITVPAPPADDEEQISPLTELARILQEVPAP